MDENTWTLIRKSNTEDIIRVSSESNNKDMVERIQKEILQIVKNCYEKIKTIFYLSCPGCTTD